MNHSLPDGLSDMLRNMDAANARYARLGRYYSGRQPLAFLAPEAKQALGNRFGRMVSNIPRLAVASLAERLVPNGFSRPDVWEHWLRNDLDQLATAAHREALLYGDAYAIVWGDRAGRPSATVESARQVTARTDPGTRQILEAAKRWETPATTEVVHYEADSITWYRAQQAGAAAGFTMVDRIHNPLGVVPVVNLRNADSILATTGHSEIDDLIPLCDALNKILADMMVTSEYVGRPRRWATGIELEERPVLDAAGQAVLDAGEPLIETVNPIPEGHRAMLSENDGAKFGQLAPADLGGYESAVRVILGQIMAVSTLPAHYVGVFTDNPASADSLRAAESSLTAKAEARQAIFGRAWEQVGRLMLAVQTGADPASITDVRVSWADAATRSVAQEADAVTKLYAAGLLPASYALARLGYTEGEIEKIRLARATDSAGDIVTGLFK